MIDFHSLLAMPPHSMGQSQKQDYLINFLRSLTIHHYENCYEYKKILDAYQFCIKNITQYNEIPFIPVRLFKEFDLLSLPKSSIIKTLTSSGTSGQKVSNIFLDKETSLMQTKVLVKLLGEYIGTTRIPMLILDSPNVIKNRKLFSARGAGVSGFSIFGNEKIYAFDEEMNLNLEAIKSFENKYKDKKIFLFGFTFVIWEFFIKKLKDNNIYLNLSNGILFHGGGWKKLNAESVTSIEFKFALNNYCRLSNIFDYYGMVEQTGSIFVESTCGYLHTNNFNDVLIRNPLDFSINKFGEKGLIQVISVIPKSYPGHSLLTEDEGIILGEDNCSCGKKGKYFQILGRIKNAEIRGCSDTFEG
jgi:phenylacetate-coenzyme A ligase PaaK-like adenylate-forming protein